MIQLNSSKKLDHEGIKVELIGYIDVLSDKKSLSKFITLTRDLEPPGNINI